MAANGEVQPASNSYNEYPRLKASEKLALVIGNSPNTFHYQMIQMYLLFFYTDYMKINPAFVASLFLVVRVFDALFAPVFGALVDKMKTPWGKYTPWFVILGIPFAISGWLTLTVPDLNETGKLIYAVVTYFFTAHLLPLLQFQAMRSCLRLRKESRTALQLDSSAFSSLC